MARIHDPSRGPFEPRSLEPIQERETNPQGVRHPFKTEQDSLPVAKRDRVLAAQARREAMR
jgi:hypothetical protein